MDDQVGQGTAITLLCPPPANRAQDANGQQDHRHHPCTSVSICCCLFLNKSDSKLSCCVSFPDWTQVLWECLRFCAHVYVGPNVCLCVFLIGCCGCVLFRLSALWFVAWEVVTHTHTHREPACIWEVSARGCDLMAPVVPELPPGCLVTLYSGFVQVLTQVNSSYFCCANSNYSWLLFWSHLSINRYQWQKLHWCGGRHRYGYYGVGQGGELRWALGRLGTRQPGRARTCATRPLTTATPRCCMRKKGHICVNAVKNRKEIWFWLWSNINDIQTFKWPENFSPLPQYGKIIHK